MISRKRHAPQALAPFDLFIVPWKDHFFYLIETFVNDFFFIPEINMRCKTIKSGTFTLQGFTPLLYATETGNIDCMKALLDHGATVAWQVHLFHVLDTCKGSYKCFKS